MRELASVAWLGAVTFIVLCCTSRVYGVNYALSLSSSNVLSVSEDNGPSTQLSASVSDGLVSFGSLVSLFERPATSDTAGAQAAFASEVSSALDCSRVLVLAQSAMSCTMRNRSPYVLGLVGNSTHALSCITAPNSRDAFGCSGNAPGELSVSGNTFDESSASLTLSLSNGLRGTAVESGALAFAVVHLRDQLALVQKSDFVKTKNDERAKKTRTGVAFIYLFVALGMTAVAGVLAVWCGWLFPIFGTAAEVAYFVLWFIIIHGISWAGGLAGWVAILCISGAALLFLPIVYICIRFFHKRALKKGVASKDRRVTERPERNEASGATSANSADGSDEQQESDDGGDDDDDDLTNAEDSTEATATTLPSDEAESDEPPAPATDVGPEKLHERRAFGFTQRPYMLGRRQAWLLFACTVALFAAGIVCIVLFFALGVEPYYVLDRQTGAVVDEFQPKVVAKAIGLIYAYDRWASIMRMDWMLQAQTKACGTIYKKTLRSDADKKTKIYEQFIELYSIDMSIYERPDYRQYSSVNDWFTRALAPGARPIADENNSSVLISLADCRLVVYPSIDAELRIWLKDQAFSVKDLLEYADVAGPYAGGSIAIFRLAPADYHLTHSPLEAAITNQFYVKSTIYSVGADAMRSNNGAIYNTRMISTLESATVPQRKTAFVAIGATCVGSIFMEKGAGSSVVKGERMQGFAFGGSTVVAVFPPGTVRFDDDLVYNSLRGVESLVQMGSRIGTWTV